jgi:hypothetical protein
MTLSADGNQQMYEIYKYKIYRKNDKGDFEFINANTVVPRR